MKYREKLPSCTDHNYVRNIVGFYAGATITGLPLDIISGIDSDLLNIDSIPSRGVVLVTGLVGGLALRSSIRKMIFGENAVKNESQN